MTTIPYQTAAEICEQIRVENMPKWYTFSGLWCRGCVTFTKGEISQRCFNNAPGCTGCELVNRRFSEIPTQVTV